MNTKLQWAQTPFSVCREQRGQNHCPGSNETASLGGRTAFKEAVSNCARMERLNREPVDKHWNSPAAASTSSAAQ